MLVHIFYIKNIRNIFTGIQDNEVEKARFRRQLEEKKANEHVEVVVEEQPMAEGEGPKPLPTNRHDHAEQPSNGQAEPALHKPVPVQNAKESNAEQVRKMLVNNYRPVQPLNGRVVYRSFPFFDEPIIDTEVVYIEKDVTDRRSGSSAIFTLSSFSVIVCSFLFTKFL